MNKFVFTKETKLAEWVEYDTTLGREKVVGLGKESCFSNTDII